MSAAERAGLLSELRLVREKYPALSADFREERTTHLLTRPIVSEGRIYFEVPDRFRREVRGSSPSVTVSNGRTLWIYYPNFNQVEIYALGQRALFDDSLAALTAGLDFQSMEEFYSFDAYREQGGYRLVLKPKRSNLKRVVQQLELWLDAAFQARKTEITLPKGDHLTTIYSNTRRAPLQPATFEFEVPQGVAISRPLGK
jgi:outer membrane lipoprotein-sorting protein